jgi:transcriptional regulator
MSDAEALDHISTIGAASLVARDDERGFEATFVPLLLDANGTRLVGHVAKGNPIWRREGPVLAIFNGVDGYVSPSWYPSKHEHGKVVPTWNYVTVHVHATMRAEHETEWKRELVTRLTAHHEAAIGSTWQVTDAPSDYIDGLLNAIVGIELSIARIEGKAKLSQNRPQADIDGVIAANPNLMGAAMRDR